ncbi:MAG: glycosyltransferase family 2 protein [Gaiellaceae bacterium]
MRFSVVIPTMRREEILDATLESLKRCDPAPYEVIVIDADPEGSSHPVVTAFDHQVSPAVRYLRSVPSLTRQRNYGIDDASGEVIVFLDDDVTIQPDIFARLAEIYVDASVVGGTGRVIEPDSGRVGDRTSPLRRLLLGSGREGTFTRYGYPRYLRNLDEPRDVEFMQGCFMSARYDAAARVRFDEHLGGYALAEDEDFSYRLSRLGRIRYVPEIRVEHRKLGFGSQDARLFDRRVIVNRAYLFRKNFPQTLLARAQFVLLVLTLIGHRLVNREWRGARGLLDGAVAVWLKR